MTNKENTQQGLSQVLRHSTYLSDPWCPDWLAKSNSRCVGLLPKRIGHFATIVCFSLIAMSKPYANSSNSVSSKNLSNRVSLSVKKFWACINFMKSAFTGFMLDMTSGLTGTNCFAALMVSAQQAIASKRLVISVVAFRKRVSNVAWVFWSRSFRMGENHASVFSGPRYARSAILETCEWRLTSQITATFETGKSHLNSVIIITFHPIWTENSAK